jgi:hypothetical protein
MGADLEVPVVIVAELPEILNCRGQGERTMSMKISKPPPQSPPPHPPPPLTAAP